MTEREWLWFFVGLAVLLAAYTALVVVVVVRF
jgi:hypothetical protein